MHFKIEQVALHPNDPAAAIKLLTEMGAGEWARDHVAATGQVHGHLGENAADLAFDYELLKGANELEILDYTEGPNWMEPNTLDFDGDPIPQNRVSHFGMHCTETDLLYWKGFFADRGIAIAQEVLTNSHSNAHIAGKRWYHYCIFDTHHILSVDIKFIVRKEVAPE